jgi:adenine-specific DNA-methyltransferase
MLELYQKPLTEIPIKRISRDQQEVFIEMTDQILAAKRRDSEADTTALERRIDRLVYDLYSLTQEEISTVEASVGNSTAGGSRALEHQAPLL